GRRPAVHRPQRRCPPPLGRRRRDRLSPRALRRAGPPSRPGGARRGRSPAAGVGGDLRLKSSTPPASRGGPVYDAHFVLSHRPFGESVAPSVYVALPSHEAVLRRLRYALEQSQAPAVLYGPPGSGKTLLARRLSSQLGRPAVHMTFPALPAAELL